MQIDKTFLRNLREKLQSHLQTLEGFDGYVLDLGNCSFNSTNATFKLEVSLEGGDTKEMMNLKRYADMHNIDLNKVHPKYTLVGYLPRSSKYPFLVKIAGRNGTFKMGSEAIEREFAKVA